MMHPDSAVNFMLSLMAQQSAGQPALGEAAHLMLVHFGTLRADVKLAALDLSLRLAHPDLYGFIRVGLIDADPTVRSFAADAALETGLTSAGPASRQQPAYPNALA